MSDNRFHRFKKMKDIRNGVNAFHIVLAILISIVGTAVCQYFDPNMDDKTYLDNIQNIIKVEVNETKIELITQAKIVDNAAKRFVAAQIKENLFIALRVLAERELREINQTKSQPKISAAKKPKQDEGGTSTGGDDDDDGEDAAAGGATTRRPNNIIPQVANLVKAVFGGNGNINLTSYVESASKLLPRPIGNQVLGFVKLLAHNPREQWTTTPSTKELTSTAATTLAAATTPQQPFIVVLPASAAGGSDNGAAAISQALSEGLVPVNSNYHSLNTVSQIQGINGTSLTNAQSTIVNFEASSFPPVGSNQIITNLNSGYNLNSLSNLNNAQLQKQQQQQQLQQIKLEQQNQQLINQAQHQQQNPIQTNGVGVPVTGTGTIASSGINLSSTIGPNSVSPAVEEDDDDDDDDQEARQLNGLGFLTTLIGGRRTERPVAVMNSNTTAGNSTRMPDNGDVDLRGVAESVRNGLGDLVRIMPDLFKGAREGFRLIQTISQVFGGLGDLAGGLGRE